MNPCTSPLFNKYLSVLYRLELNILIVGIHLYITYKINIVHLMSNLMVYQCTR